MLTKFDNRNEVLNNDGPVWQLNQNKYKVQSQSLGYCAAMCTEHDCTDTQSDRDEILSRFKDLGIIPHRDSFIAGVRQAHDEDFVDDFNTTLEAATKYENI